MTTPNTPLQLHQVPAGRRLDFAQVPGCYPYVYRRCHYQAWECVARNAHSPFLDGTPLPTDAPTEYVVLYCDAAGGVAGATAIVQATAGAAAPRRRA